LNDMNLVSDFSINIAKYEPDQHCRI
jgi:hypothetical protein